jgi:hypothetical protein
LGIDKPFRQAYFFRLSVGFFFSNFYQRQQGQEQTGIAESQSSKFAPGPVYFLSAENGVKN